MHGAFPLGSPRRQHAAVASVVDALTDAGWLDGLLLIGSMATSRADALSDVDLLAVVQEGRFDDAWNDRARLHGTGSLIDWDDRPDQTRDVAAHRWLTHDLVLVEALLATPSSGVRLAEPWRLLTGDPEAPHRLTRRPRIDRSEMGQRAAHPVEAAYDDFKARLRRSADPSAHDIDLRRSSEI